MTSGTPQNLSGRMRLIEATLSCLGDFGYQDTTVRRISKRAGVTLGLVRHHFETKNALLAAAYRYSNQVLIDRLENSVQHADMTASKKLRVALRAYFPEDLNDIQQMRIMVAFWGLILTNTEIAETQKEIYSSILDFFSKLVADIKGSKTESVEIAIGIISIADGLWLECCLNPKRMTPNKAIDTALKFGLTRITGD